jgi:2-C-methyl-D-erythritol 2,4-cyclodiphosphate synthase
MRIGSGHDTHLLVEGRPLILGGLRIEHPRGLLGHSDADVVLHAITDALLGAAGLGDIGEHFPASDPKYKGASSLEMLATAVQDLHAAGYRVVNVDSTVIAEEPRLQSHLGAMRTKLANCLGLTVDAVSVKATSPEGLGALGQKAGIAAQAVALIEVILPA